MSVSYEAHAHRFSVILPACNRRERVVCAIDSVLEQEARSPFEVIVVDDGSADGTSEALIDRCRDVPAARVVQRPHRGFRQRATPVSPKATWNGFASSTPTMSSFPTLRAQARNIPELARPGLPRCRKHHQRWRCRIVIAYGACQPGFRAYRTAIATGQWSS